MSAHVIQIAGLAFEVSAALLASIGVCCVTTMMLLQAFGIISELGNALETDRRGPGLDSGPTPVGAHQTDRHADLPMQLATKGIPNSRETRHGAR